MGKVSTELISAYSGSRHSDARHLLCHAPFSNLNFEQNGNVTACCYNRTYVLGKYPEQTIEEIWFGEKAELLRDFIAENDLSKGCSACLELLEAGNYSGTKARYYDDYAQPRQGPVTRFLTKVVGRRLKPYPTVMELELSNTCNLECVMCNGYFSSTIRANREGLPAMGCPYDHRFVQQMEQFIPHLTDLKLLGGEPFLIDLYYEILEMVARIKPSIKVHITTNGTIFNNRVKSLLFRLKSPGVVVSIDSVDKEEYERIRKRGKFDVVMANIRSFAEITSAKGTYLTLAVCPMRDNWRGLPEIVRYANSNGLGVHFNTLWTPEDLSLRGLNVTDLEGVVTYLEGQRFNDYGPLAEMNIQRYREMLAGVKSWWLEKRKQREQSKSIWETGELIVTSATVGLVVDAIRRTDGNGAETKRMLFDILERENATSFINAYFEAFVMAGRDIDRAKAELVLAHLTSLDEDTSRQAAFDIIELGSGNEWQFMDFLNNHDSETLMILIRSRYPSVSA